jgi:magnesium-transporting ATPase (P-type)
MSSGGPPPPGTDLAAAACRPVTAVLETLGTTEQRLSSAEAAERLRRYGPNAVRSRRVTAWGVLVRQLRNPLLILLRAPHRPRRYSSFVVRPSRWAMAAASPRVRAPSLRSTAET